MSELTRQIHARLIAEGKMIDQSRPSVAEPAALTIPRASAIVPAGATPAEKLLAMERGREHGRGIRCHVCGTIEHHYREPDGKLWLWCNACKHRWRWHSDTDDVLFKPVVADSHIRDVVSKFEDVTPAEWVDRAPPQPKAEPAQQSARDALVAHAPTDGRPLFEAKPWEGTTAKKPWQYRATAVIPHRDTPELLELCIRFLERQAERPYIMVVDTGSGDESLSRVLALRSESVEVHQVACHGVEEYADTVCYAMDLAMSACRTEYLWCLHSDCFIINPSMLSDLLTKADGDKQPVIGYESVSAHKHPECKGMVSHTCTILHMPTMHRLDVSWSRRRLEEQAKAAGRAVVFDPEMALNYRLRERGVKPLLLGPEQAGGVERDTNRVHLRSATFTEQIVAGAENTKAAYEGVVAELRGIVEKKDKVARAVAPVQIAPLRQALDAESCRAKPWEGACETKPWEYKVTAAIPVLDTPDELELVVELLRLQTERPYIMVVDTGSTPENYARIERLRAHDVEVHALRFNGRRHPSDFPAVAMDLVFSAVQTEFVFGTHADVFARRRDLLEWLLTLCPAVAPAVGYQITPRPHQDWERMASHTCTMYYMPAMDKCNFVWNFRQFSRDRGFPPEPHPLRPNWPDTEVPGNYRLWEAGMAAHLIGKEQNHERTLDENIDHCRTLTAGLLYSPTYYSKASAWAVDAKRSARERIQAWKAGTTAR